MNTIIIQSSVILAIVLLAAVVYRSLMATAKPAIKVPNFEELYKRTILYADDVLQLAQVAVVWVRAAEQAMVGKSGAEKMAWVLEQMKAIPEYADLDMGWLRGIVEGSVHLVKQESPRQWRYEDLYEAEPEEHA